MTAIPRPTKDSMDRIPLSDRLQPGIANETSRNSENSLSIAEQARHDSQSWVLERKSTDTRALKRQLKAAMEWLAPTRRKAAKRKKAQLLPGFVFEFLESGKMLLQSAATEVRDSLRLKYPAAQASVLESEKYPRAFIAAQSYLSAVQLDFQESSFRSYLQVVQEAGHFDIGETWLLSPMLQLNLLLQLGESVRQSQDQKSGQSFEDFDRLFIALDRVRKTPWKKIFQALSATDEILRGDPVDSYRWMDFRSCDHYREAVQRLSRFSGSSEEDVAQRAINMARTGMSRFPTGTKQSQRYGHVGYYLVDKGRAYLEKEIQFRPQGMAFVRAVLLEAPALFYFLGVEFCIFAILLFILSGIPVGFPFAAATLLFLLPVSEAAIEVINPFILFLLPPRVLPRLDFSDGIPPELRTVVAVPTLLISKDQIRDLVRTLEIRYLGNVDPNLSFALLTDPPDSSQPFDEKDELVTLCSGLIAELNLKYCKGEDDCFFHLHRHRTFNETEQTWMGWERKRGKLLDFNELLRGGEDRFPVKVGNVSLLRSIRYVITLDSDTQLPRESAKRLVGAIAHPLNQALVDPVSNTVREGYGVLQPRVGISVHSVNRSRLAYIYSGQTGLDIYTNAVSDVYQDLFGEGIFTGKGIYEVDVFRRVLRERFPSNAILSHDLIEGAYSRTGLVTEIEIIDDYPSHFSAHSRRKHRWVRGDWQILRWLFSKVPDENGNTVDNPLSFLSRWKILDNLRRSIIEAATFLLFLCCWFVLPGSSGRWTIAALALLLLPSYLQAALSLARQWSSPHRWAVVRQGIDDFITSQINVLVFLAFLLHQTLVTLDAIIRTVFRLTISRKKLLEWETAAQSELEKRKKTPVDIYLAWTPLVSLLIAGALYLLRPRALVVAAPILSLWFFSRIAAKWLDRPLRAAVSSLKPEDESYARKIALKTWRYFREFSNEKENWLIPDNIQGEKEEVAARISTTNLGLLFNAQYAALTLGFLTLPRFLSLAEATMQTTKKLERFHGHLVNWYDTRTLAPLQPLFISSVDNGNLACCLWALKQGCLTAEHEAVFSELLFESILDHVEISIELIKKQTGREQLLATVEKIRTEISALGNDVERWIATAPRLVAKIEAVSASAPEESSEEAWWLAEAILKLKDLLALAELFTPWFLQDFTKFRSTPPQLRKTETILSLTLQNYVQLAKSIQNVPPGIDVPAVEATLARCVENVLQIQSRLRRIAQEADSLVSEMDFSLFYDPTRKALSVGYDVTQNQLQKSFYDLLASEARSAVFVAIAKNEIPQDAWFMMGRTHTRYAKRTVLLSWTGTMFEYLMPALWLKHFPATLLEDSLNGAVACQKAYVRPYKIPWGISEGACTAKNDSGHFEYQAFGIPPLALKANPPRKIVITPYATALALNTVPREALHNLRAMDELEWNGRYGFHESAEYMAATEQGKGSFEVVPSWMAHHQGMILLSICNLLSDSIFQKLFHDDVRVEATERILHERPLSVQVMSEMVVAPQSAD